MDDDGGEKTIRREIARHGVGDGGLRGPELLVTIAGRIHHFALTSKASVTIGRSPSCDVILDDASVSRTHARLTLGAVVVVEDLGSANGTRVGGRRIEAHQPLALRDSELIEFAKTMATIRIGNGDEDTLPPLTAQTLVVDPAMRRVYELAEVVAKSDLNVIVLGETGVGKDVLAHHVHRHSTRREAPFVKLNCAALADSLLEAELFGYEKGAFTGAMAAKTGLLEAADGGTLFLDELGEMPLATQAKLLRAIETGEIVRVGSVRARRVNVRYLAATHRTLRERITSGLFREDLYFRLDGVSIEVPALRQRRAELFPLADRFLEEATRSMGRGRMTFDDSALARLASHAWPGNVRELRNVVRRAALLTVGAEVRAEAIQFGAVYTGEPHVPPPATTEIELSQTVARRDETLPMASGSARTIAPPAPSPQRRVAGSEDERRRVMDALDACLQNQTRAASLLGISRRALINKIEALGLPRPRKPAPKDE